MRDSEDGEFEADVGEMLGYLKFDDDGAMTFADFEGAWKYFYHDCDEATARWAFDRLCPERFGDTTVTPVSVSNFWAADLPRSFIRCLQDRSMPRWLADTVTRRLGVEQLTIDTSHSPFLSRPRELAELLVHATTTKPTGRAGAPLNTARSAETGKDGTVAVGSGLSQLDRLLVVLRLVPGAGRFHRLELQKDGLGAVPLPSSTWGDWSNDRSVAPAIAFPASLAYSPIPAGSLTSSVRTM